MKKYIIKKHCEATERCTVALGRVQDYYFGTTDRYLSRDFVPTEEVIRAYGFDSKDAADEKVAYMNKSIDLEKSTGYWEIQVDTVEFEV